MISSPSLQALWQAATPLDIRVQSANRFQPAQWTHLPPVVQRYLNHAIAPEARLASAVHLQMHGEIKLKTWQPFRAEQVIAWNQGMIWQAKTRLQGIPIRGFDRLVDGAGEMRWKVLGLVPVVQASGTDTTRSAVGRMLAECVWLPSVFCDSSVIWTVVNETQAQVHLSFLGESIDLNLTIAPTGQLQQLQFKRWGNPEGAEHHYLEFGGYVDQEGTFAGYTIPTRLRVGWYMGSDRFMTEGEFFRATIESADYRL